MKSVTVGFQRVSWHCATGLWRQDKGIEDDPTHVRISVGAAAMRSGWRNTPEADDFGFYLVVLCGLSSSGNPIV